jgi:hypothetical protein
MSYLFVHYLEAPQHQKRIWVRDDHAPDSRQTEPSTTNTVRQIDWS